MPALSLGSPYVLREEDRIIVPRKEMGHRKHTTRGYMCEVRQFPLGHIREDFLEEGSLLEQFE